MSFGLTSPWAESAHAEDSQTTTSTSTSTDTRIDVLQEIVVTARKREEPLQVAPVSVSAVSGADLQQAQITRIDAIAQFAPSLNIEQSAGEVDTLNIVMRGIGDADPILTNDSPVAVYVDGVYLGRTAGSLLDLVDIDRIEVLRGPQGTLFGRNTTGGAVSLFTQGPAPEFGVKENIGYASNNEMHSTTTLNTGELGDTGLSAKVTYKHHQMDGYIRNELTDWDNSPGADTTNEELVAVRFAPEGHFTADYKFDNVDKSSIPTFYQIGEVGTYAAPYFGNSASLGGAPFDPYGPSLSRVNSYADFDHARSLDKVSGHSLTLTYEVNDALKIKSITAYRSMGIQSSSDLGNSGQLKGYSSPCPPVLGIPGCSIPETIQNVYVYYAPYDDQHQHQLSQEFQFGGQYADLTYVTGLYYFDEHVGETSPSIVNLSLASLGLPNIAPFNTQGLTVNSLLNYTGTSSSKAVYTQESYAPTQLFDKRLELTVGARYTQDEKTINQDDTIAVRDLDHTFYNFSPSGSLKYQWTRDLMTYFRYAEAYKAGGFSARAFINGTGPNSAYLPEKAKTYEIGVKTEWLNHHVRLNADLYKTNYDDLQVPESVVVNGTLAADVFNAGKASYQGGELELTVLPYTGWQLNGTFGYVDPKYVQFLYGAAPNQINIAGLAHYGDASTTTASASAQYTFVPMAFGNLTLRADWTYVGPKWYIVGDFTTNAAGQAVQLTYPGLSYVSDATRAPGNSNLGAQIILDNVPLGLGGQWQVMLYGKNLLNDYPQINGLDLTSLGVISNSWDRGRVVGVNLEARF